MADECIVAVDVSPQEVDAGGQFSLTVIVSGLRQDLKRPHVVVCDGDGDVLTSADLRPEESGALTSGEIIIAAPRTVGPYAWRVKVLATAKAGAARELAAADVRFAVVPHTLDLNVWDVPAVVVAGRKLKFQAGIRCWSACAMGGQILRVADVQGRQLAAGKFGDERWPETEAIYAAEVELAAPAAVGQYDWEITAAACNLDLPHAPARQQMAIRVVNPPDCVVTVEVRDRETKAPLSNARVVLNPYRATTDADGIARVPVAKGQYDLLVARGKYTPVSMPINVRSDLFTSAELETEPPRSSPDE